MKVKIQRSLMEQFLKRVQGALIPTDPVASLIILSAKKDADGHDSLSGAVSNDTLLCSARIDAKEESMLEIEKEGTLAVEGGPLLKGVSSLQCGDVLELNFEPRSGGTDDESDEVGTLTVSADSEKLKFQCVDRVFDANPGQATQKMVLAGEDFIRYVGYVGIAAGKPNNDAVYSNICIELQGSELSYATTNGQQLAIATTAPSVPEEDFTALLPYDAVQAVTRMCSGDQNVAVSVAKGKPTRVLFEQPITYAMSEMGTATYRITSLADKFPPFRDVTTKLDFVSFCKVDRESLRGVCNSLDIFPQVRTHMEFSVDDSKVRFHKKTTAGQVRRSLSIGDASGDDMEMEVSSRHIAQGASIATEDEILMKLSGSKSLGLLELGSGVQMYFMPFTN